MVQKSKGGKKCRSVIAGKKAKDKMKHHRKKNYKKKVVKKVECCVCMEEIPDTSDNTITCGKVNHALCGTCKMKCEDCPMCRSHKVQKPISQNVNLRIVRAIKKREKQNDRINVSGLSIGREEYGDGNYEKIDIDKNGHGIYKHEIMERYIYKQGNSWVLDDIYSPNVKDCIGYILFSNNYTDRCLLKKNNMWRLSGDKCWISIYGRVSIKRIK